MKYKTEAGFCEDTTKLILGLLIGHGRRTICVPEVPHGFFSNEQIDMMLLDVKNQEYLCIEYKLNNPVKLQYQVKRNMIAGIPCVGIINTDTISGYPEIFRYTGMDAQIEKLAKGIVYRKGGWRSIFQGLGLVYYWAYRYNEDNFRGGITGGGRVGFASVYRQAIANLHKEYGKLDFHLTHAALRSHYSVSASRKHYRLAGKVD